MEQPKHDDLYGNSIPAKVVRAASAILFEGRFNRWPDRIVLVDNEGNPLSEEALQAAREEARQPFTAQELQEMGIIPPSEQGSD